MNLAPDKSDCRHQRRDSLYLLARVRVGAVELPVKVRNLSSGGAMLEGAPGVGTGDAVSVSIRNIGWVDGHIAWIVGDRCGIAFRHQIEPSAARFEISGNVPTSR